MAKIKRVILVLGILIIFSSAILSANAAVQTATFKTKGSSAKIGLFSSDTNVDGKLSIGITLSSSGQKALAIKEKVYSVIMNADITLKNSESIARIILIDSKGNEYLVYEANSFFPGEGTSSLTGVCDETCYLNGIIPSKLRFELKNASIKMDSISYSDSAFSQNAARRTAAKGSGREIFKIRQINDYIKQNKMEWTAGKTFVSGLSYSQKKRLFRNKDGTLPKELPNLYGFEYYIDGVFEMPDNAEGRSAARPASRIAATSLPKSWNWNNASGENWMTSVKSQGYGATCWAFAEIGAMEAQINLYYNQHLNVNLSEQMRVDCTNSGEIKELINSDECEQMSCYAGNSECYLVHIGIVDEGCDKYAQRNIEWPNNCDYEHICKDWSARLWKSSDFREYTFDAIPYINCSKGVRGISEEELKKVLISKGPLSTAIPGMNHAMVLAGYDTDENTGETIWSFKNSWGCRPGYDNYFRVKLRLQEMKGVLFMGPFTPPEDKNYWPKGFDGTIKCYDKDGDGYCNWGITAQKPSTCPAGCKVEKDCDDSNPLIGPFDSNFACTSTAQTGKISISSMHSGVRVFLKGINGWTEKGIAPVTLLNMPYGEYTFLFNKTGYHLNETSIYLGKAEEKISVNLSKIANGDLTVTSNPEYSVVYLNVRDDIWIEKGETPIVITGLAPGNYTIQTIKQGYESNITAVEIGASSKTINTYLKRIYYSDLDIKSSMENVSIYYRGINGGWMYLGKTPLKTKIPYGTYDFKADPRKSGFFAKYLMGKSTVEIPLTKIYFNFSSPPDTGALLLTAIPSQAEVYMDNKLIGYTSIMIGNIPYGTRKILLKRNGYCDNQEFFDVKNQSPRYYPIKMLPEFNGTLKINTDPPGAWVTVHPKKQEGAVFSGTSPATANEIPCGIRYIRASKRGYQESGSYVEVDSDLKEINITLTANTN